MPMTKRLYSDAVVALGGQCFGEDWERRFADLVGAHRLRPYHSWQHIREVLGWVYTLLLCQEDQSDDTDLAILSLAAFYHDAIYDTNQRKGGMTNEEASAMWATSDLAALGVDSEAIAEITRLIRLTSRHQTMPHDRLGQVIIDADLAILASPEARYLAYSKAIRVEYGWVDDLAYAKGRGEVLRQFLDRERIFYSPLMDEARARQNLSEEIRRLASGEF